MDAPVDVKLIKRLAAEGNVDALHGRQGLVLHETDTVIQS